MINDKETHPPSQPSRETSQQPAEERIEQFNELSEISLEERMNAADHLGIPARSVEEASKSGRAGGVEEERS